MKPAAPILALLVAPLAIAGPARAADWPDYLGPGRTGVSEESGWNTDWATKPPKKVWTANVGVGCASFAIKDGKAITTGNLDKSRDVVWCFDAATGDELWRHEFAEDLHAKYYEGGTSATPVIDGPHVFTVSKSGKLFCLDLASGEVRWMVDYVKDLGGKKQTWGWAASPLVAGGRLLVDPGAEGGAVAALDKETGTPVWKSGSSQPGYASPDFYGTDDENVAFFHGTELVGYRVADGRVLFKFPWETKHDVNASIPRHHPDGYMFISSGYGTGAGILRMDGGGPELVFEDDGLQLQFQPSLRLGDRIVAVFGDRGAELAWLDVRTGKKFWGERVSGDRGSVIKAGDHLIVLTDAGELICGAADDDGFRETGRLQVLRKLCWAAPAIANGRLFLRNNGGDAVCLSLK